MALIQVKSNSQLIKEEEAESEFREEAFSTSSLPMNSLRGHVMSAWDAATQAKETTTRRMEAALRRRNGEYDPLKLAEIKGWGGSEIFMMLTDEKCSGAKAWIEDILFSGTDKPWTLQPTPIPELPENVLGLIEQNVLQKFLADVQDGVLTDEVQIQERMNELTLETQDKAVKLAKKIEANIDRKIDDLLKEGNWEKAMKHVIEDVIDLPCGILKGPIVRKKKVLEWVSDDQGNSTAEVVEKLITEWERVSPFDVYPSPTSIDIEDGYFLEVHRLTRSSLSQMKGVPGYDSEAIDRVLDRYGRGGFTNWLRERGTTKSNDNISEEQDKDDINVHTDPDGKIEALQFWGNIQGKLLKEFGIEIEESDELSEFAAEIWVIGSEVIKAELNGDPLGRKPYYKTSFRERNGSFWGDGLPDIIDDIQDFVNAAARSLVNNMALASGPMMGVDVSKLAEGEDPTGIHPWRIFQLDESKGPSTGGGRAPIFFFQPNSNSNELMQVYQFFSNEADAKTGIPKFALGGTGDAKGAFATATGTSMLLNNALRGIKAIINNIDTIIASSVKRMHEWMLLYSGDPEIQGDVMVVAKGSSGVVAKESQQVRRNEFLQLASNPDVMNILGKERFAAILRAVAEGLNLDVDDIVPTKEEIRRQEIKEQQAAEVQQALESQVQEVQGTKARKTMASGEVAGGADVNTVRNMVTGR